MRYSVGGRAGSIIFDVIYTPELPATWAEKLRLLRDRWGTDDKPLTQELAAARLGVNTRSISSTLYDAFGQRPVSTMNTQLNQYHVVMEVAPMTASAVSVLEREKLMPE